MKTGRKTRAQHEAEKRIAEMRADALRIQGERLDTLTAEVERLRSVVWELDAQVVMLTMIVPEQAPELVPLGVEPEPGDIVRRELFREFELRMVNDGSAETFHLDLLRSGDVVRRGRINKHWHFASVADVLRHLK